MIARGAMLGPNQPVIIHMLDIEPAAEALNGVKMELIDAAFPLLKGVVATTDIVEACNGVNIAVMVGGFPRKEGMERKDVMSRNVSIYKAQASALEQYAASDCKGTWVSMGVSSDGSYGIPPGLIYSFPVTCEKGEWSIVQGLKIDEFSREKMDATTKELMEEKSLAYSCLN
ncbi:UNVERIFIED_CONTAM: Malate dehydrogenase, cytoplasmic [Sesamum angustifolium]|uniref:malate dehydrogenase n=1 Tax=Sesamum angustifolium TaxID=2727405 RepID=A0AAW2NA53_9LAMI